MSNFSLCDTCAHKRHRLTPTTCMCRVLGETVVKTMQDHNGEGGVRYDEVARVCGPYVARKDGSENE